MRPSTAAGGSKTTTLDASTLANLHRVLLGHDQREFPAPWRVGFTFRETGLLCGLKQRDGGPCGVLAAVQAYVLRALLQRSEDEAIDLAGLTRDAAGEAVVAALTHIIWSVRVGRLAQVVGCKKAELPPLRAAADELTVTQCTKETEVAAAVRSCIGAFIRKDGPGVALLLYSLALTRGIAMIARDADFETPLIGINGYCSQELVNLLLIGRAHSNVFNGERSVGGDGGDGVSEGGEGGGVRLKGVPRRAHVGFLTLFERQGAEGTLLTVGSNYKRPLTPVFVVQSESHYSVLWAQGGSPPDLLFGPEERLAGDPEPGADEEDEDCEPPVQMGEGQR